ncbi:MAG: HDIG domain-containing metalloprotein [Verrucomicrobiota bacterium]|nr:HDIG domain-containing metalloprotein [Verrucomicrobiota bacterium]
MAKEENKGARRMSNRERAKRRKELVRDEIQDGNLNGQNTIGLKWSKQVFLTIFFATALIFICFVGQDPPSLRTLGEVAPENVYSDRDFKYISDVRRIEAEEWIRSSTPREFAQNFAGEEAFSKAIIRLQDGLLNIDSLSVDSKEQALLSLVNEMEANFKLVVSNEELKWIGKWQNFSEGRDLFSLIMQKLRMLHLRGVVKYPSTDQKFISEANATRVIESAMLSLSSDLVILSSVDEGLRFLLSPDEIKTEYPFLARNLDDIKTSLEDGGPFPQGGLLLHDLIESADENASFEAQKFRNDLAAKFSNFAQKGLHLRTIDREATTASQERAIAQMEPSLVSVEEGDIILKMGSKVTEADLEKYSKYLNLTLEDRNLLPKRVFITIGTFLFSIIYITLIMPNFWKDTARSGIVSVSILANLGLSRFILELGGTELFGENAFLVGLLPSLLPLAFASMIVMTTVGPRMATLTALMTSIFHATMQNAGIDTFAIGFSSALMGAFFCREVRLRGSALKAGALAGLTAAVMSIGIGLASGSGAFTSINQAGVSLFVGVFTGALVLGAMPLIENVFKVATDATLFELTDFNHPLLRKMQVEAPGTYHHSLMVANLSENAAIAVGANPILCRAASLFHDIGKMTQPNYFTENQGDFDNPHDQKNPSMSALIIKSHVKEGIDMAREHKLPKILRDVIRQHHGTTLVKYFYHQAQEKMKQETLGLGDMESDKPDESTYRYDGPRPRFKESAIIFFADSVEAAARSLPKVTQHSVEELLENIFSDRLEDGQLDECPLTLEEVSKIKRSFVKTTLNMLHTRVEYPTEEKNNGNRRDTFTPFNERKS